MDEAIEMDAPATSGFYWFNAAPESPNESESGWQVVEVHATPGLTEIYLPGSDQVYQVGTPRPGDYALRIQGIFIGPLIPPAA